MSFVQRFGRFRKLQAKWVYQMRIYAKPVIAGLMMLSMTACAPTTIDYVKERQSDKTMTVEECELRGGKLETRDDGVQVCKVVEFETTNQDSSWLFSRDILMGVFVIAAVALASGGGGGGGFTDDDL